MFFKKKIIKFEGSKEMLVITFSTANQTRSKINFDHITSTKHISLSLVYANVTIVMEFNFIATSNVNSLELRKRKMWRLEQIIKFHSSIITSKEKKK